MKVFEAEAWTRSKTSCSSMVYPLFLFTAAAAADMTLVMQCVIMQSVPLWECSAKIWCVSSAGMSLYLKKMGE